MELINTLFFDPFLNLLMFLYQLLGNNMGLAIIALTLLFKLATLPLNLRMLSSQRRMQQLRPKLEELKEAHGKDRMALAQAQMELYKAEGVSPTGSCLPLLLQLPFLFGLYAAFNMIVHLGNVQDLNNHLYSSSLHLKSLSDLDLNFWWLNLAKTDHLFILPVLAGLTQFVLSKMTMPSMPKKEKTSEKKAETSLEESLAAAQGQMVYLFPIMTLLINLNFPSGLGLYWTAGNIFSIIQQFYINRQAPMVPPIVATSVVDSEAIVAAEAPVKPKKSSKSSTSKKRKKK
jgi:YidC/Oxa1 family membrane protein insertase